MGYYRTCPDCGANLDPGERCDCQEAQPAFLSIREVATRWNVSYDLVYNLVIEGKLGAVKIGGCWRIHRESVTSYETANTATPLTKRVQNAPVLRL